MKILKLKCNIDDLIIREIVFKGLKVEVFDLEYRGKSKVWTKEGEP
jgi:hypothetical protein